MLKKTICIILVFFALQLKAQNAILKMPSYDANIKNIESIILQEKVFYNDTIALKKYLQPLFKTKNYLPIYDALLANGYSNFYNATNKQSDFHYSQSIKKAKQLKNNSLEIWTELNYISYLYNYNFYPNLTPLLLKLIERIEKTPEEQLILANESFKKIGWMLQTLGDYNEALKYLTLAKKYTPKNTSEYAAILDAIGINYFKVGNLKLAESHFKQTAKLAQQIHDEIRYGKALGNLALIEQERGNNKAGISLLEEDIQISKNIKNNKNTIYASILLAKLYIADKNFTKAESTLNKIQNIVDSKSHFEKLELEIIELKLQILRKHNKSENELELRRRMLVLEDSIKDKDGDMALNNVNWLIQKTKFQQNINKSENKFQQEATLKNTYAVLIVFVSILAFCFLFLFKKQQKFKLIKYEEKAMLLETEKNQIEQQLQDTHQNLNDQLIYLKEKNVQIKKLTVEISKIKNLSSSNLEKNKANLNTLLQSHLMTDENWNNFKREFHKVYPEFYEILQYDYPEITDSNKRILLLHKLNFKNNEIARLIGVTPDAVKKSKQRLKKKLGEKFDNLFDNVKF